jgi:hypothetical protein
MKIIYNSLIPFKGFSAINLFGVLFVRKGIVIDDRLLRHENIHTKQMKELGYVFFYLWYVLEWVLKLFKYGLKSYYNISFEREAYAKENELLWLSDRKRYAFLKYL